MATRIASFTSNRGEFEFNASQFAKNIAHLITKKQANALYLLLAGYAVETLTLETITPRGRLYVRVLTKRGNALNGNIGTGGKCSELLGAIDYQN